ncbi:hypothetical protein JCM3770_005331 [Rhodotorula araucariae]
MPTPRAPPSASVWTFDVLPRVHTTSFASSDSSALSASSHGAGASDPLLSLSDRHPGASSHSASPTLRPSTRGALPPNVTLPSPSSSAPFLAPLPRSARRVASERWAVFVAVVVVVALATLTTGGGVGAENSYATSVREGWRAGFDGVRGWADERWQAVGPAGAVAAEDILVQAGSDNPTLDKPREVGAAEGDKQETISDENLEAALEEEALGVGITRPEGDALEAGAESPEDEPALDAGKGETTVVPPAPALNVHPVARPPPRDPEVLRQMRFLSYENHSGFHNQRKSLVNALTLAHLLNRTLLLPPARLGAPVPWELDPKFLVHFSERCKAHLEPEKPVATKANAYAVMHGEMCDDPAKWTYAGWDWLVTRDLLVGRPLIDRWNASHAWFTTSPDEGGLGLRRDEIYQFADHDRRSYQIFDAPGTAMETALFTSRIELDDLRDEAGLGGKRLLRFGSLFSSSRLRFVKDANRAVFAQYEENFILQNDGLDAIGDKIRDQLGSYVAAHARVGDGVFKSHAKQNMQTVFQELAHDVLGMDAEHVKALLVDGSGPWSHSPSPTRRKGRGKKVPRAFGAAPASSVAPAGAFGPWGDGEHEDAVDLPAFSGPDTPATPSALARRAYRRRALKGSPSRPLAPALRCRRPLHDAKAAPHLTPLNVPLYIATDSRSPTTDAALAPFMRWFPCVFFLSDFAAASEVNDEPVPELVALVESRSKAEGGSGDWTSDWDGQPMAKFLYPFLEAQIAARAVDVVGTPSSTFSGYVGTILHGAYVQRGLTTVWNEDA